MPRPSQAAKDAAFRNQNRASGVAVAAGPAVGAAALIPGAGPFVALGIAAVGAAFGIRAIIQGRIVHDPPRDDYTVATTMPPPRFDTSVLGQSDLERSAAELIRVNDETTRAFEAMIVALERASGAELANDAAMTDARVAEAVDFALRASEGLQQSSERTGPFRSALDEIRPDALTALDEVGIPREYLPRAEPQPSADPIADLSDSLGQSAESDYEFARELDVLARDVTLVQPGES